MGATDFTPVRPEIWTGNTAKACKGDPVALWLLSFLPTHFAQHSSGLYAFQVEFVAFRFGLDEDAVRRGLAKLAETGYCDYDPATDWVFVTRMAEIRHPDGFTPGTRRNDNMIKHFRRHVAACPSARLRDAFTTRYASTMLGDVENGGQKPPSLGMDVVSGGQEPPSLGVTVENGGQEPPSLGVNVVFGGSDTAFSGQKPENAVVDHEKRHPSQETQTKTQTETREWVGGAHAPARVHVREAPTHPPAHPLAGMKTRPSPDPRSQAEWDALDLETRAQVVHLVEVGEPAFVERYRNLAGDADAVATEYVEAVRDEGGTIDESGAFDRLRRAAVFLVDRCNVHPGRAAGELRCILEWARRDRAWRQSGKANRDLFVSPMAVWGDREGATFKGSVPIGVETKLPRNLEMARAWKPAAKPRPSTHVDGSEGAKPPTEADRAEIARILEAGRLMLAAKRQALQQGNPT